MVGKAGRRDGGTWARAAAGLILTALPPSRLPAQDLVLSRLTVSSAAVDSIRRLGVDVVTVEPAPDGRLVLTAVLGDRDRDALVARGLRPVAIPRPAPLAALEADRRLRGARAFTVYRDFDDPARGMRAWLTQLAQSRTNVAVESIGASVEGRPILAVKIGPAGDAPSRPNVLVMGTYHAREWAATEVALRLIQWLADSLALEPGGAALLGARDVWVIPVVNPDGYQYTFSGQRLWRKNRRANADGTFGVDLNRNHAGFFGLDELGSSGLPGTEIYRGPAAESEPETRAIAAFHAAHPPVTAVSYHSYAGAVLYPWSHSNGALAGDDPLLRALAGTDLAPAIADSVAGSSHEHYHPGPGWHLYPTNGDYVGWAYRAHGTLAFTVEVTAGCCLSGETYGFEFPDDEAMLQRVFRDNLPFALSLIREAAAIEDGSFAGAAQLESVWPEVRLLAPPSESPATIEVATDAGRVRLAPLAPDSLGAGRALRRQVARAAVLGDVRAVRAAGLTAEIVARESAELAEPVWQGWTRVSGGVEGLSALRGENDTLASPPIGVAGRTSLALRFWTAHAGSAFAHTMRGLVQVSLDGGPWSTVHLVLGAAPVWYPVVVPLPEATGATSLRVRFVAVGMPWLVDAIALASGSSALFAATGTSAAASLDLSANPVRGASLTVRWDPAPTGQARVEVFTMLGTRVMREDLSGDPGRWQWGLVTQFGAELANGVYFIVVTRGDGQRLRRRVLVAR